MSRVELRDPILGATLQVAEDRVETFLENGYERVEQAAAPAETTGAEQAEAPADTTGTEQAEAPTPDAGGKSGSGK